MPIALSGPLTRAEVMGHLSSFKAQIEACRRALPQGAQQGGVAPQLEVDLQGLTQVDTSALAMMLAVEREARAQGVSVCWRGMPPSLEALARLSSVTGVFQSV